MSYLPRTKVIDGKQYKLHDDYLKRDTAKWEASKLKSKGFKIRIVKLVGLYGLYKRSNEKRSK